MTTEKYQEFLNQLDQPALWAKRLLRNKVSEQTRREVDAWSIPTLNMEFVIARHIELGMRMRQRGER